MGISYETLSKDLSQTTYSGGRQGLQEERTGYSVLQDFLNEQKNDWIYAQFIRAAYLSGVVSLPGYDQDPSRLLSKTWNNPGWPWIDPRNDAQASQIKIELGISSRTREARAQGADFDECVEEQIREEEKLAKLRAVQPAAPALPAASPVDPGSAEPSKENDNADASQAA